MAAFATGSTGSNLESNLVFAEGISRAARGFQYFSQSNMGVAIEGIDANRVTKRLLGSRRILPAKVNVTQPVICF